MSKTKESENPCGLILNNTGTIVWDWTKQRYWKGFIKHNHTDYLEAVIRECWPIKEEDCPFKHSYLNEEGVLTGYTLEQLDDLYGNIAETSYYSFQEPRSRYNPVDSELLVNPAPQKYTQAVYNKDIDEWLKLLGGEEYYETLCDWLASLLQLDKPASALYFNGPPGCGKSLFAKGAGSLWAHYSVAKYENILKDDAELLKSPVILIDEYIKQGTGPGLQRLIRARSHPISEGLYLKGYLRFVIASTNSRVLRVEEKLSKRDIKKSRDIIYIKIDDNKAKDWFEKHNLGDVLTDQWMYKGGFAQHVLWLASQRDLKGHGHFLVKANVQ